MSVGSCKYPVSSSRSSVTLDGVLTSNRKENDVSIFVFLGENVNKLVWLYYHYSFSPVFSSRFLSALIWISFLKFSFWCVSKNITNLYNIYILLLFCKQKKFNKSIIKNIKYVSANTRLIDHTCTCNSFSKQSWYLIV